MNQMHRRHHPHNKPNLQMGNIQKDIQDHRIASQLPSLWVSPCMDSCQDLKRNKRHRSNRTSQPEKVAKMHKWVFGMTMDSYLVPLLNKNDT